MKEAELKHAIVKELGIGKSNSVMSAYLERVTKTKGSTIRKAISDLRADGYPICSWTNGYYWAESQEDIRETIDMLNHRCYKIIRAAKGMEKRLWT